MPQKLAQESLQEGPRTRAAEPSQADYDEFCATVMASARGRWFLAEYARRHRKADTDAVLAALHRIEDMVRAAPAAEPLSRLRDEVRTLSAMVRGARNDLAASGGPLSAASKVMALLDLLEQRIDYSLAPGDDRAPLAPPPRQESQDKIPELRPDTKSEASAEAGRTHLSVVPPVRQTAPRQRKPVDRAALFPSVALLPPLLGSNALPAAAASRPQAEPRSAAAMRYDEMVGDDSFAPGPPANDALPAAAPEQSLKERFADVMALSENERIALFS